MYIANEKTPTCLEMWRSDKCQAIPDKFRHIYVREKASASQTFSAKTTVKAKRICIVTEMTVDLFSSPNRHSLN